MNEIFVKNLETNISRVVDALRSAVTGLESKLPIADYTSIIDAISKIKLEKNDLTGIEASLASVISVLEVLKEKKIDTGKDEILKSLKDLISAVKNNKPAEHDLTDLTSLLADIKYGISGIRFPEQKEVAFPERYPLPEEQLEALKSKVDEEARLKLDKMIEVLKEIRVSVGGGGTDVVGLKNLDSNGRETRVNAATEETLQSVADGASLATNLEGSGTVTIGTTAVELTFTGKTKNIILTANQSNTGIIYIGKSNVTNLGANALTFLMPGESLTLDYNDATNALYAVSDTASQSLFKGSLL